MPVESRQNGFLVLSGIDEGPAQVLVDGVRQGNLYASEMTITLPAGAHQLIVRKQGYADFVQAVTVPAGDVVQVAVRLIPREASFIRDQPTGGSTTQQLGRVRVVHLDPASVPIGFGGKEIGQTTGTIQVPVGNVRLTVGRSSLCFRVQASDSGFVRIRGGHVEEVRYVRQCVARARGPGSISQGQHRRRR